MEAGCSMLCPKICVGPGRKFFGQKTTCAAACVLIARPAEASAHFNAVFIDVLQMVWYCVTHDRRSQRRSSVRWRTMCAF